MSMTRSRFSVPLACVCFLATHTEVRAQVCTEHTFLGNAPNQDQPGWHHEANGLTHDEGYWLITQNAESSPQL